MSDYLNPVQVAEETGLGLSTVYRALEAGELPGSKVRGRWITLRAQLEERIHDERTPRSRATSTDPMPRPRRATRRRGSFRDRVVDLDARRSSR